MNFRFSAKKEEEKKKEKKKKRRKKYRITEKNRDELGMDAEINVSPPLPR